MVLIDYTKEKPLRTILMVLTVVTMLVAIFCVTPWYGPPEIASIAAMRTGTTERALLNAFVTLGIGGLTLAGIRKRNDKWMSRGAFCMFLLYLFTAMGRAVTIVYPFQLLWVSPLMVAIVFAIIYVYYRGKYRAEKAVNGND